MTRTTSIIVALIFVAVVIGGYIFPPWQAERRFESFSIGSAEQCLAAQDASESWASFGNSEKARYWGDKADTACAMARLSGL